MESFSNLIQNVVCLPSVLLSASQNLITHHNNDGLNCTESTESTQPHLPLYHSVSKRFSIEEMGREIFENRFDLEAHCAKMSDEEEKINDGILIDVIKRLFDCGVLRIELGRCSLGKGLPQECGLCSILINVYFNGFDREIQEMRLRMSKENPKLDENEMGEGSSSSYKPLKMYAVRYLDDILVITSGSKMLTMNLKKWVLGFLEGELELNVDRVKTAIHSAVSEKIDFLGMELQAVPPSVLHPPMSEKAIRARKKYLRQKEVKALELKNARERNRKKLGLKLLSHVFKKSKQSDGLKFSFEIENEVREIFQTWADEVVQEFLGSLEERWTWHRMLTASDFLSLRHIRDQLPQELVDSYDKFQEQVDKHLSPVKARKALEEEGRKIKEEEERKGVKMAGFTNKMGRPRPISILTSLEDADIVKWYAGKKHEATKIECIRHYTKDLKVPDLNGNEEVHFPTEKEVKMMGDKNLSDPKPVDGALSLLLIRLASDEPSHSCIGHFCDKTDTVMYRVRLLQKHFKCEPSRRGQMGSKDECDS
ncbi:COX1/OXI3 INTRON 1 PROTEIN-RELATED [Salix koriyanagi]|uniref:COX1/OXI3 INTRON 1 PROTEIN-RELATED n=1 Tax=Salix koriyanagi TaxID=2511006 RepID=A0A9Q0VF15_9ROSI|nr:COX1/OXI3 INTRON 1 PROTEIN-RELATED [Salix koriyanagi]